MFTVAVAKRYAEAFLEFTRESIGFERGMEELRSLRELLRENPDFARFLASPGTPFSEKRAAAEAVMTPCFSEEILYFLLLLLKKNRFDNFRDIAEYARLKYSHGDEVDAVVMASYPLWTEDIEAVKMALERHFAKRMHIYMGLDPSLLGGVKATIGNIVIDGSVSRRLDEMKAKLMKIKVDQR